MTSRIILIASLLLSSCSLWAASGWVDVTAKYVSDPSFSSGNFDEWTMTRQSDYGNIQSCYGVMEMWNSKFRFEKKLTGLPNGSYRFRLQGYYRTADAYTAYVNHKSGSEKILGYMFANSRSCCLHSIFDEYFTSIPSYYYYTASDGHYYPDSMGAAEEAFNQGKYQTALEFTVTDGTLDFGVYCTDYVANNWLVIDNIALEQYSSDLSDNSSLVVNEVQVANIDQYIDDSFNYGGWIELYNPTSSTISLFNCFISDDTSNPQKFDLSILGSIEPHGYKVIYFDHNSADGTYGNGAYRQVPFKLDADGGTIYFYDIYKYNFLKCDYPESISRCSYARTTDGGSTWRWTGSPTPGSTNSSSTFADTQLAAPVVDTESGFLSSSTLVGITAEPGATIRYTLDGSTPTLTNGSSITGTGITIYNTGPLRCRAFKDGYLPSAVVTHTYIFNDREYSLPVISVNTDKKNLYDDQIGVYTDGTNGVTGHGVDYKSNLNMDWERPVNFEYITSDGKCVANQEADFCTSGGWSRHWGHSSFKIKAAKRYEHQTSINYPFFASKAANKYRALVVRNGGNDTDCRLHDAIEQGIISSSGFYVDTQAFQPTQVLLNGEYIGMLNLREPNNKHFGYSNYGIDTDEMDAFEIAGQYVQDEGTSKTYERWLTLSGNASSEANYNEIKNIVDIDEFTNYMAAETYLCCWDWLTNNNNCKGFRSQNDGKFHLVMFDTDSAWDLSDVLTPVMTNYYNSLSSIFKNMTANADFKRRFIDAYCIVDGSVFEPTRSAVIADSIATLTSSALSLESKNSFTRANAVKNNINNVSKRTTKMNGLRSCFGLDTGMQLNLCSNISEASFLLNGQVIPTGRFSGTIFPTVEIKVSSPACYNFVGWQKSSNADNIILSPGSNWNYYDGGSLDGQNWQTGSISWANGDAPLGYSKTGIVTTISYGDDANNKTPTYYFRKTVNLSEAPTDGDAFTLSYTVDDGFVIYVNGVEAGRYNMPSGTSSWSSYATTYASGNPDSGSLSLNASLFKKGDNIIAVEVHNNSATSSDIYWDAEITRSGISSDSEIVSTDRSYTFTQNDDCTLKAVFEPLPQECLNAAGSTPVVINEVSADNTIFVNDYYKKADWIELYNTTNEDIDLAGMYLSDNLDEPKKYQITSDTCDDSANANATVIPAHGYKVIWADKLDPITQLHASFKLGNDDGESVILTAADGSWADSLTYMAHTGDESVGRYPDGGKRVYKMSHITIGAQNMLTSYAEWLSGEDENFDVEEYLAGIDTQNINTDVNATKCIENGQVIIIKSGKKYTLSGQRLQ